MLLEEPQLLRATYLEVANSTARAMDAYGSLDRRTLVVFCVSLLIRRAIFPKKRCARRRRSRRDGASEPVLD